jgi:hypothetical protein
VIDVGADGRQNDSSSLNSVSGEIVHLWICKYSLRKIINCTIHLMVRRWRRNFSPENKFNETIFWEKIGFAKISKLIMTGCRKQRQWNAPSAFGGKNRRMWKGS